MPITLAEIAETLELEYAGDGSCIVESVADISKAGEGSVAFVYSGKYEKYLDTTGASVVILKEDLRDRCKTNCIFADNPRLVFARVAQLLYPAAPTEPKISTNVFIHESCELAGDADVEDGVVIKAGASIASGVSIGANSVIAEGVKIGSGTKIYPNVTILNGCEIGENCILHSGVVIGADGFGFVPEGDRYVKVPQVGGVKIGDDVEVGANTTIDRGAIEDTVIGNGVKLDNQIQVAHNVVIGDNTVISAGTAIAGTTKIGKNCLFGGCVAIRDNIEIADNVVITGRTLVSRSLTKAGSYSSSTPIDETGSWRKNSARFRTLDELARRVKQLESMVGSEHEPTDKNTQEN